MLCNVVGILIGKGYMSSQAMVIIAVLWCGMTLAVPIDHVQPYTIVEMSIGLNQERVRCLGINPLTKEWSFVWRMGGRNLLDGKGRIRPEKTMNQA